MFPSPWIGYSCFIFGVRCPKQRITFWRMTARLASVISWLSPPWVHMGWVKRAGRGWECSRPLHWCHKHPWSHTDTALLSPSSVLSPTNNSAGITSGSSTVWSPSLLLEMMQKKFRGVTWVQEKMPRLTSKLAKSNIKQFSSFFPLLVSMIFCLFLTCQAFFSICLVILLLLYLLTPFA